ncbi:MAG: hypothetical protein QXJ06_02785 [Candidatus Aenigmatarchaeota archaeon]
MRLVIFFIFITMFTFVFALTTPNNHFEVVPSIANLNLTNNYSSDVYIYFNKSDLVVEVLNSTPFKPIYSQQNILTKCQYTNQGYKILVLNKNESIYNATIEGYNKNDNVTIAFLDLNHLDCSPGRYASNITFIDKNNQSEYVNLSVYIDIPISLENNLQFNGNIEDKCHSFYFNSSLIENSTNVIINVTPSQDIELFLLEGNSLLANSNNIIISKILPLKIYEIRLCGKQNYLGNLVYSGLNASVDKIDFGTLNVSHEKETTIFIENTADFTEPNINENIELYHLEKFYDSSQNNFTFIIPENVLFVKAVLEWDGNSNYSLTLYDSDDIVKAQSYNRQKNFKNANVTSKEYIYFNNPSSGLWKIEVKNLSAPVAYNLTIYQQVPSYILSNFSSINLNKNQKTGINISIKVPETAWNGKYEGTIKYNSTRGGAVLIPIEFNVTTGVLLVNNSLNFNTLNIIENYGKNATVEVQLPVNNTGIYDLSLALTSSLKLYNSNNSINITHPNNILLTAKSSKYVSINFTFNDSAPKGTYIGWIYLNTTGEEPDRAHPKPHFNISVQFVLTDELRVDILEIKTSTGTQILKNPNNDENVTVRFKIFYINNTEIEAANSLGIGNIQVWLNHANLSYRIPTAGSLSLYNGTNPIYWGGDYEVNFTVPANKLGGIYNTYVKVIWDKNEATYTGTGLNNSLIINNTALYMSTTNSTSITLEPSKSTTFLVNITNYGERSLISYNIKMNESCSGYSVSATSLIGCSGSISGDSFIITPQAYSSCGLIWTITSGSNNASACTAYILASPSDGWYDPAAINISVTVRETISSTITTTTTVKEEEIKQEEEPTKYFSVEMNTKVTIEQGKNNTLNVKIKNLYTKSQTIKISISSINSSWFIISPNEYTISKNDYYIYRIIFKIPEDATLGDYKGKLKVESKYNTEEVGFTLSIIPGDSLKILINTTISAYEKKLLELEEKYNNTQNETVKIKIEEIKAKIGELKGFVEKNDYSSAYSKLYDVKKLFDEFPYVEENLIKPKSAFNWNIFLLAGSGVLFTSVLAYSSFEYIKKKGFSFKVSAKNDNKKELREIKNTLKIKELESELKELKEKEKHLEEEIKEIEKETKKE